MLSSHHWAHNFVVEPDDIDYLVNSLLEKETPLTTRQLARELIAKRLNEEVTALEERCKDAEIYNPARSYKIGQKLVFPALEYATAVIADTRVGLNDEYEDFNVIKVQFDDETLREFASDFKQDHKLNNSISTFEALRNSEIDADNIVKEAGDEIIAALEKHLHQNNTLTYVTRHWFPRDLIIEINEGHLNLAEAVLDIASGGPLTTTEILEQIGGLGNVQNSLQVFSLNYALNKDSRFTEVGPAGEVLWYLTRLAPNEVKKIPQSLNYQVVEYDRRLLTDDMLELELEICDELSPIEEKLNPTTGNVTLIYPHRRCGTLPLNANIRHIFPSAKSTAQIWVTLVDQNDGEEFEGWVIPASRYVYGLLPFYNKYNLPIGAYVTVSKGDTPDRINLHVHTYKARAEWVHLMEPKQDGIQFEDERRNIGADYDDLMLLGIDNLETIDQFIAAVTTQKRNLASLLKMLLPALGQLTPQKTVHVKTLYSTVNVLRRYPPGAVMALLEANPDFENVGGHYWKLAD